jgi:hypothetical protein
MGSLEPAISFSTTLKSAVELDESDDQTTARESEEMLFIRIVKLFVQITLADSGKLKFDCNDCDTWTCGLIAILGGGRHDACCRRCCRNSHMAVRITWYSQGEMGMQLPPISPSFIIASAIISNKNTPYQSLATKVVTLAGD